MRWFERVSIVVMLAVGGFPAAQARPDVDGQAKPRVYMVTLSGEFGRDVALSPMKQVIEDAKRAQPDVIVLKVDCTYEAGARIDDVADPRAIWQVELLRHFEALLVGNAKQEKKEAKTARLVCWIKNAKGGGALLPLITLESYYTSDAIHAAPDVSANPPAGRALWPLAQVERMAYRSGFPLEIADALVMPGCALSFSLIDGKPKLFEDAKSGETLLTGPDDLLTLDAAMAKRLGLSRGTADTPEELFSLLGIDPNNVAVISRGDVILAAWRREIAAANAEFHLLMQQAEHAATEKDRLENLNAALRLVEKYGDSLTLDEWSGEIETKLRQRIAQLQTKAP